MSSIDEQALRDKLREHLGSLEISPAPILRVTRRGRGIRARRRALTGGSGLAAAAAVVLAAQLGGGGQAVPLGTVTLNAPNPAAPGGVFASGTANGRPWRLAVRNIAADPGTPWCLPAVMVNGHDGDVLFPGSVAAGLGNTAILPSVPGLPGISLVFSQVAARVTGLTVTLAHGRAIAARPVWVAACGQRFHLAGFAFAGPEQDLRQIGTYGELTSGDSMVFGYGPGGAPKPGIWDNMDSSRADAAASRATRTIGQGRTGFVHWAISESLGLFGQCYAVAAHDPGNHGNTSTCVPVSGPPATMALNWVPFPLNADNGQTGYAGLVSPRTSRLLVDLSNGRTLTVRPTVVTGRAYVAFTAPPRCSVLLMRLFDSAGHRIAVTTQVPAPS